jgi:hypothetical protein
MRKENQLHVSQSHISLSKKIVSLHLKINKAMHRNKILLIIVVIMALIATTAIIASKKTGTISSADKNFAVSDTASVNKIFLANKDHVTTLLERNPDGTGWTVNGQYEASVPMINLILTTVHRIRPASPTPKTATENIIKRLAHKAIKVEIYGINYRINFWGLKLFPHETMLKCYYVGDVTQDNLGTYMLMDGSKIPFVVVLPGHRGYVASRYEVDHKTWRTHRVFDVSANEIESVRIENTTEVEASYIVNTNVTTGKFDVTTLTGEPLSFKLDSLKVYNYLNSFKRINFESFTFNYLDENAIDSMLNLTPNYLLTLTLKSGITHNLRIYPMIYPNVIDLENDKPVVDLDRCYAYLDSEEMVVIQYFTFDKILRPRSYFYLKQ